MSFDAFTIAGLVDEFSDVLIGGRVQDVIDVDEMGIGLEIYAGRQRHYLYMSADASQPRVHLTDAKLRRGLMKPTQLGLLMRRYVKNGAVMHISQPAWERLLHIDIAGGEGEVTIIIEPMVRRANVLLVQDGIILDCLKRVGPEENRYRLSLPNHDYVPPPPLRHKLQPDRVTADDFQRLLAQVEKKSSQTRRALTGRILGISPLLAKEIVFNATGATDTKASDTEGAALFAAFQTVVSPLLRREWRPGIGLQNHAAAEFSVFPLSFMAWQAADSINEAIATCFGSVVGTAAYDEAKKPVRAALDEAKVKLASKLASLQRGLKDNAELESLKQRGELILAWQYQLQAGQQELKAQYDAEGPELVIPLNPSRSPLENAQDYFRRYEKAKAARRAVPQLIAETRLELDFVAQLESDLISASNWIEIDDVIQALQARGHWQGKKLKRLGGGGRQGPLKVVSRDGYVIWIGRSSRQNEKATFSTANSQDIWLHVRNAPGAHVIIRNDGRRIKDDLILAAAAVAAWYSQKRSDRRVLVDYTRVKYVKAIKGAGPGMVTYRNEQTISVQPQDETILQETTSDRP